MPGFSLHILANTCICSVAVIFYSGRANRRRCLDHFVIQTITGILSQACDFFFFYRRVPSKIYASYLFGSSQCHARKPHPQYVSVHSVQACSVSLPPYPTRSLPVMAALRSNRWWSHTLNIISALNHFTHLSVFSIQHLLKSNLLL